MNINESDRMRMKEKEKRINKTFKFGETIYQGINQLEIPMWIGEKKIYNRRDYIYNPEIPWLIGRKTLFNLVILTVENCGK